jgi:hypothetical protein
MNDSIRFDTAAHHYDSTRATSDESMERNDLASRV